MTGEADTRTGAAGPWAPPVAAPSGDSRPFYSGSRARAFWLALTRMSLTIITLGVARFWMVTRLRRHYWSAIQIDGAPLEYTGRAIEKLTGFLIAVVVLAVYLLIVNLGLAFIGLSWFQGNPLALQAPLVALLPLTFWARYRARRYIMARTRWRGVRFGLAPGAWGYTARAIGWWGATLFSLGFLYPLMQMKMARFTAERSYFGDLRFDQQGNWWRLLASWLWFWAPLAAGAALVAGAFAGIGGGAVTFGPNLFGGSDSAIGGAWLFPLAPIWLILALIRHQVFSFRYLTGGKRLGGLTGFASRLRSRQVIWIHASGWFLAALGGALAGLVSFATGFGVLGAGADGDVFGQLAEGEIPALSGMMGLAFAALAYLPAVAVFVALRHAFVVHPMLRVVTASLTIHDLAAAARARQRGHDEQAEAGGFADALGADIGGAF